MDHVETWYVCPVDVQTHCIVPVLLLTVLPRWISVHPGSVGLTMRAPCCVCTYTSARGGFTLCPSC